MRRIKYKECELFNWISFNIRRLIYIHEAIENGRFRNLRDVKGGWGVNSQLESVQDICQSLLIINLNQNNTYVTCPEDVLVMKMVYMEIFDNLETIMDKLDLDRNFMYYYLSKKIGKVRYKQILKRIKQW